MKKPRMQDYLLPLEDLTEDSPCPRWWTEADGALAGMLDDRVEVSFTTSDSDYQGDIFKILLVGDYVVLWRDSFGSCDSCDALMSATLEEAHVHVKATLAEGNSRVFTSYKEAAEYLDTTEDFWWASRAYPREGLRDLRAELGARS